MGLTVLSRDDVAWITSHPDACAEAEPLEFSKATEFADGARLRSKYGQYGRALAELMIARRSVRGPRPVDAKVSEDVVDEWLVDAESVQQATALVIAQYRARRLALAPSLQAGGLVHDVTCSIGSELAALAGEGLTAVGSDIDPGRVAMARHNMAVLEKAVCEKAAREDAGSGIDGVDPARFIRPLIIRADALCPVSFPAVVIADPARRAQGRRISQPQDLIPPLPGLIDIWRGLRPDSSPELVVKCAPGIDYSSWDGEVEIISVVGAVKEACLWTPEIAASTSGIRALLTGDGHTDDDDSAVHQRRITRRATLIHADGSVDMFTDTDPEVPQTADPSAPSSDVDEATESGKKSLADRYIVDPDGAIVRAGLVRQAAYRWGMRQIDPHIAFLTGDTPPAGVLACEVLDAVPLSKLTSTMAKRAPEQIEILVRGVAANPDHVRAKIMSAARKHSGKKVRNQRKKEASAHRLSQAEVTADSPSSGASGGSYTIVITQVGDRQGKNSSVAFICGPRRVH
ncbi:hypothetical protein I6J22_00180 [Corynebacterium kroppenstedtii]|uniref:hypothetical protein n=1 Tax=Corynebacterium kroppenstedtii TaxID=161879 RepID=UPI00068BD827|nr:hypothetical protein [Corynebacterium kroppenstedtii]QRP10601.1 hypothetical protein I6J22_00180 [Corynebacterium kroppenstedtii]